MNDSNGRRHRIDGYLRAITVLAQRGAFAARPGPWADVLARAQQASRTSQTTDAPPAGLDAQFQELALWSEILRECVLPDPLVAIASAIHRIGAEEAEGVDGTDLDRLLCFACPDDHATEHAATRPTSELDELAVIAALRAAERLGSCSSLAAALRATLSLADNWAKDEEDDLPRAEAWPILTVRWILVRSLWETMPVPHRTTLAQVAQATYYRHFAPDQPEPRFLTEAPRVSLSEDDDGRWPFTPAWGPVANCQRSEDPLGLGSEHLLREDIEVGLRLGAQAERAREEEAARTFAIRVSR